MNNNSLNIFAIASWLTRLTVISDAQAMKAADIILHEPLVGYEALTKVEGIGKAKAMTIYEATRYPGRRKEETKRIGCSRDAYNSMVHLAELGHEEFHVIYISRSNRVIKRVRISIGGVSGTITDIRIILKTGLDLLASAMILAHNHPSGNTNPSEADKTITKKIKEAAKLMDISVLDHIIVGGDDYLSFADQNLM